MHTQDIITLVANISLTLTFLIGLVFGIVQARDAARNRRERLTLETLRNFQTHEFAELIQFVNDTKFPETEEELNKLPARERVMFIQFAQQMESLGMLVAEELIDLDLVDKTLGSFVTTTWKKYKVVFQEIRDKRDPYLGEYYQWLAVKIAERLKSAPRDPYYVNN